MWIHLMKLITISCDHYHENLTNDKYLKNRKVLSMNGLFKILVQEVGKFESKISIRKIFSKYDKHTYLFVLCII